MTAHLHTTHVEGCFRCDLSRDEAADAMIDALAEAVRDVAPEPADNFVDPDTDKILDVEGVGEVIRRAETAAELAANREDEPERYVDPATLDKTYAEAVIDTLKALLGDDVPTDRLQLVLAAGNHDIVARYTPWRKP